MHFSELVQPLALAELRVHARCMIRLFRAIAPVLVAMTITPASAALLPDTPTTADIEAPAAGSIDPTPSAGEDMRIAERLSDIYANVPSLADVEVEVSEGVVTLSGLAPDADAAARAEAIAGGVEGVVTIENAIERDVSVSFNDQVNGLQELIRSFLQLLPLLAAALVIGGLIAGFGHLLASFAALWRKMTPNSFLADLIASAIRFGFVILAIVVALDIIGAGALMGAVLGGAGVIGIALGFAMRDTVENYVASLMLSLRHPFQANDHIVIDQQEGHVIRLTSRATILMTLDGNHLRIPNSTVFKAVILNYSRNPQRRFLFMLGVDADDDALEACAVGRRALSDLAFVLDDPKPEVHVDEVGDSNVSLKFLGWVDQRETDFGKGRSRAIAAAKEALECAGFALPEPIYRLRFDQRTGPLPLQTISEHAGKPAHVEQTPHMPRAVPESETDVAPEKEITRLVEEERAGPEQENDLLDPGRPIE